jgi:hypothetical protein
MRDRALDPPLGPAPPTALRRSPALLPWALAFAVYVAAYAGAIHLGFALSPARSLLSALANCLPEVAAAPLVLRWTRGSAGGRRSWSSAALLLAGGAIAFVLWTAAGASLGFVLLRGLEDGVWRAPEFSASFAWKAMQDLLLFACLVAVGVAQSEAAAAREAAARAERAERLRAEARLAVLRANLNPHFILNVLHSLMGLAERDPASTSAALERLGAALRFALRVQSRGMDLVPLGEELAFARDYLELERLRLGDRLTTEIADCGAWLERPVPSFVLQPLVENAIRHAVAPRARGGTVAIAVREESGGLVLTVDDDGTPGSAAARAPGEEAGLGLALLRDRLAALYGDGATLLLGRSPAGGFRAEVRLAAEAPRGAAGEREDDEEESA